MKTARWVGFSLMLVVVASGCAAGLNDQVGTANGSGLIAGFWWGLWHGLIAPVTFIVSLFTHGVRVYEVHNNGGWYDFGFMCGLCVSLGGSSHGTGRRYGRRSRGK